MLNKIESFKINNNFIYNIHTVIIKTNYFKIKFRLEYYPNIFDPDKSHFKYRTYKVTPTRLGNELNLEDFEDSVDDFKYDKFWDFGLLDVSDESNRYIRARIPYDELHKATICDVLRALCYGCITDIENISTSTVLKNHKSYKKTKPKDIKYKYKELMNKYMSDAVKLYNKMDDK